MMERRIEKEPKKSPAKKRKKEINQNKRNLDSNSDKKRNILSTRYGKFKCGDLARSTVAKAFHF